MTGLMVYYITMQSAVNKECNSICLGTNLKFVLVIIIPSDWSTQHARSTNPLTQNI